MIVLFRSCETNISPGSTSDGTKEQPRWNGKYKGEILRKCYLSVAASLDERDILVIINDNTSKETLEWMKEHTKAQTLVKNITPLAELRTTNPRPTYHPVVANSCEELASTILEWAKDYPEEVIYVCEDDYLHVPQAILNIKTFFGTSGYEGFFVPQDYPDRYYLDNSKTCEVFMTKVGHVRTIPSATLTVAAKGKTWSQFKYDILQCSVFASDAWTHKAFNVAKGLSPIPGWSTHLQENCITPVINWNLIYESIKL